MFGCPRRKLMARCVQFACLVCLVLIRPSVSLAEASLAFGQWGNGGFAWSAPYNYRTQAEAQAAAMNGCNARGYNCSVRVSFRNVCFALAIQNGGNGFAWSTRPNVATAQADALARCNSSNVSCSIQSSYCDNVSEEATRAAEQESARQQSADYQKYAGHWQQCFLGGGDGTAQSLACNLALNYPRASYEDRTKLLQRRDVLVATREAMRVQREQEVRLAQEHNRLAAEGVLRQATQRAAEAEQAARRAAAAEEAARASEQRAQNIAAEQQARATDPASGVGEPMAIPNANESNFMKKPVSEATAWAIFLFCLYAAIKETVKAKAPPQFKFLIAFGLAATEYGIYLISGFNPGDPKIVDVISMNIPLIGVAAGFGFFIRHSDA
jgi:hypothetical protein